MYSPKSISPLHPVLSVSQLTAQIRDVLEEVFENVVVVGEISNAKVYSSGHWYFSLKDKDATLPCVCFKAANSNIKFRIEDGLMVVIRGKLNVYPPKGGYQLVANALEPVGIGEWQLAFQQLKERLTKEGLLDADKKRPIPILPRRIGVVTSTAGAALRDILSALARRNKLVNIVIANARVQGEGSAEEVARAIYDLQQIPDVDVILVARGGGSIEDLWSFNSEVVARAIRLSRVPVISGVGHETDITICDLAADLRAPTPTAAAELVARGAAELIEKWHYLRKQMLFRIDDRLIRTRQKVVRLSPVHGLNRYHDRLKRERMKVLHDRERMLHRVTNLLTKAQHNWAQNSQQLQALSPQNILSRGFSILRKTDGHIVRRASDVCDGDILEGILFDGSIKLVVIQKEEGRQPTQSDGIKGVSVPEVTPD